jgi:Predicted AAA-ATPase/PD-(D/E)XK nuclease superfamily
MQKPAVGIQTLAKIREYDYVYVDKTPWAYELLNAPAYYFLSRPRRFGKSLFLNTLLELFSGNKSLFENCFIYDKIDWQPFPIVHLSFEMIDAQEGVFEAAFIQKLENHGKIQDISVSKLSIKQALSDLIIGLNQKYKQRVVVLIDEYDKPLLDFIGTQTEEDNKLILRYFYETLKSLDSHIHFVFITGITKFAQLSLFSSTNNLTDITLNQDFNGICGYTKSELETNFKTQIEHTAARLDLTYQEMMAETKLWYNGYSWGGEKVYNPYSIARLLFEKNFDNFWFQSGSTKFLIDALYQKFTYSVEKMHVDSNELSYGFTNNNPSLAALMFQTGYLTITDYDRNTHIYTLDYPNKEVTEALQSFILQGFVFSTETGKNPVLPMYQALLNNDIDRFVSATNQLFAHIPEPIFLAQYEAFYHAIIYLSFSLMGIKTRSEEQTNKGRMDMVVTTPDRIFIIEYKILGTAADALTQIHEKKYYEKFMVQAKPITLIGIALGKTARGIVDWTMQELIVN